MALAQYSRHSVRPMWTAGRVDVCPGYDADSTVDAKRKKGPFGNSRESGSFGNIGTRENIM